MDSRVIRQKYLDFFKSHGHAVIPPAPLVPPDDPTTLFNSSGMQQLVPYLKGQPHPMGTRLTDSQPSYRAQDIEEVGDNRHTTFFEMLGNWSLGDYFKEEQLTWVFEFLTQAMGLNPDRLYATVYVGSSVAPKDETSISVWQKIFKTNQPAKIGKEGFNPKVKIYMYPDNWWSRAGLPEEMPVGEIGGPDSEVFFDFDPENKQKIHEKSKFAGQPCHVNCDCGRFLEIGNSVFMEYIKTEKGFEPLSKKSVDFGGGLERLTAVSQEKQDIFQTDLFWPIIEKIESITGSKYDNDSTKSVMRVAADHLKASVFMIAAGIEPSNKAQGYFLRRCLRRAAVKMRSLSGVLTPIEDFKAISQIIVQLYRGTYFDQGEIDQKVNEIIENEMGKFSKTLEKGLRIIEATPLGQVNGKFAFNLFQSYGFPFEIVQELLVKKGKLIDKSEFDNEFKKHQDLSRTASVGMFKGGLADHSEVITKYHTATHLLQAALRQVLGDHIQQVGSNNTNERLRFDFTHPAAMTSEEIKQVEDLVNQKIKEDLPVTKTTEDKEVALKSGALAFFRGKYPDKVTVYTIGKDLENNWFSKELCGGPHVASTGEIGGVRIKKEEAVGTGKRRIYVVLKED